MGIRYYRLFDLLNRRGMKKSDLRQVISSATVAKLSKGEAISFEALEKICLFLNCQPGDVIEIVREVETTEQGTIIETSYIVDAETDISATDTYIETGNGMQLLNTDNPIA